jgi:hypothetical protein
VTSAAGFSPPAQKPDRPWIFAVGAGRGESLPGFRQELNPGYGACRERRGGFDLRPSCENRPIKQPLRGSSASAISTVQQEAAGAYGRCPI